jgi:hypothetical protein
MITLNNINLSSIDLSGIDLRGIKLGLGGRGGGSGDGFPQLPGDVTRWHFGGLTNEMMAAMDDPRIEDADHKGRFLSFKNFAWKGMSGVGGYEMNFNLWTNNVPSVPDISMSTTTTSVSVSVGNSTYNNNLIYIHKNNWDTNKNHWLKITSTYEDGDLAFLFYNDSNTKKIGLPANGYVNILAYPEFKGSYMYISTTSNKQGSFTIEQLPLYPGALVFDGVDDYGVCENFPILNKEKGYTVVALRRFIYDGVDRRYALMTNADPNGIKDGFILELVSPNSNKYTDSFGSNTILSGFEKSVFTYQTSKYYNGAPIKIGEKLAFDKIAVGTRFYPNYDPANVAIWEICILDHDATEEELTKIKDYFVKTYPWLFPDQAWTVAGKTNEDEDRATIANITGNGNNLVLSNFGFAEGSGYGLYKTPFELYPSVQHSSKYSLSFSKFALGDHNLIIAPKQNDLSYDIKVKVTGLKDGVKFKWGWIGTTGYIDITTDGIHMLNKPASQIRQLLVEFAEDFDPDHVVTIEQIPEYEGYLVTDGVDDKVESSLFTLNKDWTIVGNWTMLSNIPSNCGIIKVSSMFLYNSLDGVTIYFAGGPIKIQSKSINAFCSDGRIYLNDWTEILKPDAQIASGGSKSSLNIASYSANFTKMAFKNLAIYDGKNLSKDDCIKAYNYLQTLKAK